MYKAFNGFSFVTFTYSAQKAGASGWYHTFTDADNTYIFQFNSDLFDEEESWEIVKEAIMAAGHEKGKET